MNFSSKTQIWFGLGKENVTANQGADIFDISVHSYSTGTFV